MPTYEYQCPEGHAFEKIHKMSERPRVKCPVCGKPAVRRISGGAGLVFKGSGFYITDYGKDGKGPRKAEGGEAAAPVAKPEAPAADAKPASSEGAKTTSSGGAKPAKPAAKAAAKKAAE